MKKVKNCTKLVPFFARDGRLRPKWTLFTLFVHYFKNTHSNHSLPLINKHNYLYVSVTSPSFMVLCCLVIYRCIFHSVFGLSVLFSIMFFCQNVILFSEYFVYRFFCLSGFFVVLAVKSIGQKYRFDCIYLYF